MAVLRIARPLLVISGGSKEEMMSLLLVLIGVVVVASSLLLWWNEVRYGRRGNVCLPPGTMGWPLFGETTEFLKQGPSFMKQRRLRYVLVRMVDDMALHSCFRLLPPVSRVWTCLSLHRDLGDFVAALKRMLSNN